MRDLPGFEVFPSDLIDDMHKAFEAVCATLRLAPQADKAVNRRPSLGLTNVSEDIAFEVLDRAFEADETLTDGTKRFIDRHINLGEKRPPAPSVRRDADIVRKKLA
jgi:hypothetical protein